MSQQKKILILGSTGSIGINTLDIIRKFPEKFKVSGLVAFKNRKKLKNQIEEFKPEAACIVEGEIETLEETTIYKGNKGVIDLIKNTEFDIVVAAISGTAGILPTFEASKKAQRVALANKESLVSAGMFITKSAKEIIPVDSEHSAIFQALQSGKKDEVKEIILTASGGPFRGKTVKELKEVTIGDALNHPNWKMGTKVTIDSATMMNKGLEVIEAWWLFNIPVEKIKVVVHPQSIIHSMVRFCDNSFIAQLGKPDMRIPIAYALSYPDRLPLEDSLSMDYTELNLSFEKPDTETFKCLKLAYQSLKEGYPYPIILNAANEVAVNKFLEGKISFLDIPDIIEKALNSLQFEYPKSIEDVMEIDRQTREFTESLCSSF